ncbi:MAG: hypothetical protein QME05_03660 [Candidatus Margulisbacteria bacterium]|nr:hypothetical protein [Candidatus Margulisiibacteriota bacterium]
MKKVSRLFLVSCFLSLAICSAFLMFGCGSESTSTTTTTGTTTTTSTTTTTTTTSTTTTTGVVANYVDDAKSASIVASGTLYSGNLTTQLAPAAASSIYSVHAATISGPPDFFFSPPLPSDGYMIVTTLEVIGGNLTPYLCFYLPGGTRVTPSLFSGKKIATFEGFALRDMFSDSSQEAKRIAIGNWIGLFTQEANPYAGPLFTPTIDSLGGYTAWSYVCPIMEAGSAAHYPYNFHFTTPEVTAADKISSMECKMVFQNNVTGEIRIDIATSSQGDPKPIVGSFAGSSSILIPGGTLDATATLNFVAAGANDVALNYILITGSITPGSNTVYISMDPVGNSGTGLLSNEAGTLLGTIEITAVGGTFYPADGSSAEAFLF